MSARLREWWAARTLRWQLIAGLLALLVLTCVAVGAATTFALRGFLFDRLNQQVDNAAPFARGFDPNASQNDLRDAAQGQQIGTFGGRLLGGQVTDAGVIREIHGRLFIVPVTPSAADTRRLGNVPANGEPHSTSLSSLGRYRVIAFPGQDGDTFFAGLPMSSVTDTIHHLELIELVVFGSALILAGLAGAGLVRFSLRPLRRVAATANAVTQTPLSSGEVSLPTGVPEMNPDTEVGQVATAFNRMLEHVQDALTERYATEARLRQFIADASHELRTPIAAIRSHAELTKRQGGLPPEAAHALNRVESESERMGVLVDDLLLLARLDAGRPLAREEVDLTRLTLDATSDARAASPDHRWVLELPDHPVLITGDSHRLHQVLANLLTNARVHTPANTTVTVRLTREVEEVELSVTDNGPGIPESVRDKAFERFVRADTSRARTTGSTGLGLSIVHAVVLAHSGTVSVTSEPGHTRFVVKLPAGDQVQPELTASDSEAVERSM